MTQSRGEDGAGLHSRIRSRLFGWFVWGTVFVLYGGSLLVLSLFSRRPRTSASARRAGRGIRLLVTGRFDSRNWCRSHLLPLVSVSNVREIIAVVDGPIISDSRIRLARPPAFLRILFGRAVSKALWMLRMSLVSPPEVVMGYHIFPGALSALFVARIIGARAVYQMTAGPVELIGGGTATENALLSRLGRPSPLLERLALRICSHFDMVVVRGQRACDFLSSRSVTCNVEVIVGSIDVVRFEGSQEHRCYDVAYVGRFNPIKQPDHVVSVVAALACCRPGIRAVMVGDGPLLGDLRAKAASLHISSCIEFLGHVEAVEAILIRTKVFILTSRSEGLSIALAEAMAAGVVPVVADVGDLGDLVQNGITGWRVTPSDLAAYAQRIHELLGDERQWRQLSGAARMRACEHNSLDAVIQKWERCLSRLMPAPARARKAIGAPIIAHRSAIGSIGLSSNRRYRLWQRLPTAIKNTLARPIHMVPTKTLLGSSYRTYCRFANESDRWPLERARAFQLAAVRRICRLAYERSKFYRKAFRQAELDPDQIMVLDDLRKLPTIDRNTVQANAREMCTVSLSAYGIESISTGGTGGKPLRFFAGADRSVIEYAYLVASWRRAGYQLGTRMAVFRGRVVPEDSNSLRHEYDPILRHHCYSVFHLTDENVRRYLEHVRQLGTCFLHVYPSSVDILAGFIRRSGMKPVENIRGIIAESETVYPEQRRRIEDVFGCRLFSCYGHSEKLILAAECEHSTNYHVWPTYGYFELLDDAGDPVTTPGQRGEIVGTGFINRVMPFIRYRTGDRATYVSDKCAACGRAHPIIKDISGHRVQEVLIASDGAEISWTALNMHDDTFDNVRQFQFRQDSPGHAILRIVPAPGFSDADAKRIQQSLARKLDGRLAFTIESTDVIALTPRGKAIYVDQRIAERM